MKPYVAALLVILAFWILARDKGPDKNGKKY